MFQFLILLLLGFAARLNRPSLDRTQWATVMMAARAYGVSRWTVWRAIDSGALPGYRPLDIGPWVLRWSDLAEIWGPPLDAKAAPASAAPGASTSTAVGGRDESSAA